MITSQAEDGRQASSKIVYFLRHGESEANAAAADGRDIRDPALTELGCLQAAAWASETGSWEVERVLVSPLMRTLETALLAFPGARLHVKRSLREHGWHEDQNKGSPVDELQARLLSLGFDIDSIQGLSRLGTPHPFWDPDNEGGLSREELHVRRKTATRHLERELFKGPVRVFALVCHYVTIKHFVSARLHNCEVVRAEFQRKKEKWVLTSLCQLEMPVLPSSLPPPTASASEVGLKPLGSQAIDSDDAASIVAAEQSSGLEDLDELPTAVDALGAVGTPATVKDLYARKQIKHASVLLLGKSRQYNKVVALLGGGVGREGYRYCDFGGGLDGGPARFGGRAHKLAERRWPHLGAFRELAEEFLGLHGDEARSCASKMWQAAADKILGGGPVEHGNHLLFLVPAEAILDVIPITFVASRRATCKYWTGSHGSCRKGDYCKFSHGEVGPPPGLDGIDALEKQFVRNSEVSDVKLFSIEDLLASTEPEVDMVRLLVPTWTSSREGGRPHVYPTEDQLLIETAFQAGDDAGVSVLRGKAFVKPVSMIHMSVRHNSDELRSMQRLDCVRIRKALRGPRGSLTSCAAVLRSFSDEFMSD